jgi:hypothetical protein
MIIRLLNECPRVAPDICEQLRHIFELVRVDDQFGVLPIEILNVNVTDFAHHHIAVLIILGVVALVSEIALLHRLGRRLIEVVRERRIVALQRVAYRGSR